MIPDLPDLATSLDLAGQLLAAHWLLSAALLILVGALLRAFPEASAATRHRAWLAGLVVCAMLPLGAVLVGAGFVPDGLRSGLERAAAALGDVTRASERDSDPASVAVGRASQPASDGSSSAESAGSGINGTSTARTGWLETPLASGVFAGWALIFCGVAARRLLRLVLAVRDTSRLRSQVQSARVELAERMERVAGRIGTTGSGWRWRPVAVAELPDGVPSPSRGPFCLGVRRPCVVVPVSWLATSSAADQEVALLHETAHGLRRDGLALIMQQIARCLLPLHPIANRALGRLVVEREAACDDFVLRSGMSARRYAESLLRQAERCVRADSPSTDGLLLTAYLGSPSQLARRLLAMTDPIRSRSSRLQWAPTLAVAVLLGGSAAVSLAAWPALARTSGAPLALTGAAFEPGAGLQRPAHRRHGHDERHGHHEQYAGRTVLSADDSSLYPAVRSGDVDRVGRLLDAGEDVNEVWPGDGSPLMVAAHRGNLEMVEILLQRGADVDLAVGGDGTPLIGAVRSRNLDLVQALLDAGASIDDAGFGGDGNPLIAASLAGDVVTARYLVELGAAIDIHVPDDDTPLINAAQQGHVDVVRYLLDEGADPNLTGDFDRKLNSERTPLNQAEKGGHADVAQMLRGAGAID